MTEKKLAMENLPRTLELVKDAQGTQVFRYIDERFLPQELKMVETTSWMQVVDAIKTLAVRGAPAIGCSGAAGVSLWFADPDTSLDDFESAMDTIANARPTAVNLSWAVKKISGIARKAMDEGASKQDIAELMFAAVKEMEAEDEAVNRKMGAYGAELLNENSNVLTHCNAGSLACSFYGTALGVIYAAAEQGKINRVYSDETRPVGQGARLTVWELAKANVPVTLICDNMAASLMAAGQVDAVVVGADRITANGDTANKIGTYGVAVLAKHHGIPFYVAAPLSTIDFSLETGAQIPIEQRNPSEVLPMPIQGVDVWNPAFDVTPAELIAGIITERGVFKPTELDQLR